MDHFHNRYSDNKGPGGRLKIVLLMTQYNINVCKYRGWSDTREILVPGTE